MKKRPIGFTVLAIFLWWLTLAGVANAIRPMGGMHPAWAVAYAVCAFITALGLWKVRAWAFHTFLTWAAIVIFMSFTLGYRMGIPLLKYAVFIFLVLVLLSSGAIYIKKGLRTTRQTTALT